MISLQPYHTFRAACSAQEIIPITTLQQIHDLVSAGFFREKRWMILGQGSNVLFRSDFEGTILINQLKGISVLSEDKDSVLIECASGEVWHDFVMQTVSQSWSGLENLAFIPGTVGAAPLQNIGAYGAEVKDVIDYVTIVDLETNKTHKLYNADCHFGYRDSIFKNELQQKCIIISVTFRLDKNNIAKQTTYQGMSEMKHMLFPHQEELTPLQCAQVVIALRKSKLPDRHVLGTAGSFFKNPIVSSNECAHLIQKFPSLPCYPAGDGLVKLSAGRLIEQCGLKGWREGDAGTYEKHALVLVNYGNATGEQIRSCAQHIINNVYEKFGVTIEPEVNCV